MGEGVRQGGRGGADIHSRTPDRKKHSYSEPVYSFRWMTLLSLSVCLALFFLSLSSSLSPRLLAAPEAKQKSADVCTNTMTLRSCAFLNQQRQTQTAGKE